jgi:oxygen-dependent protoporphyrinogen oxidase
MKVAVLGGGIAGLSAGLTLRRAAVDVTVFEADKVPGGKIATVRQDDFLFEDGPNALTALSPLAAAHAREYRLEALPARPPRARFVWRAGKRFRAPSLGLLGPLGMARALLEPLFALASSRERDDEPLTVFLVRHFGKRTGVLIANLMAAGVYAGDPHRLSATDAFPRLASLAKTGLFGSIILGGLGRALGGGRPAKHAADSALPRSLWSLRGGLHELPSAMASELGPALRLGAAVAHVAPSGAGWEVATERGSTERFDAMICALPSGRAAALLRGASKDAAEALDGIRYAPLAVVHLGVREQDFPKAPRGFGVLDGEGNLELLGTLFPSSLFEGRAPAGHLLLTTMVGGIRRPELTRLEDGRLVDLVRADLQRVLGLNGLPVIARVHRWDMGVPQYEVGHAALVERAEREVARLPPLQLVGAAYHGVSVELALQSGAAAARRLSLGDDPSLGQSAR